MGIGLPEEGQAAAGAGDKATWEGEACQYMQKAAFDNKGDTKLPNFKYLESQELYVTQPTNPTKLLDLADDKQLWKDPNAPPKGGKIADSKKGGGGGSDGGEGAAQRVAGSSASAGSRSEPGAEAAAGPEGIHKKQPIFGRKSNASSSNVEGESGGANDIVSSRNSGAEESGTSSGNTRRKIEIGAAEKTVLFDNQAKKQLAAISSQTPTQGVDSNPGTTANVQAPSYPAGQAYGSGKTGTGQTTFAPASPFENSFWNADTATEESSKKGDKTSIRKPSPREAASTDKNFFKRDSRRQPNSDEESRDSRRKNSKPIF
jgi:hypothetical protein